MSELLNEAKRRAARQIEDDRQEKLDDENLRKQVLITKEERKKELRSSLELLTISLQSFYEELRTSGIFVSAELTEATFSSMADYGPAEYWEKPTLKISFSFSGKERIIRIDSVKMANEKSKKGFNWFRSKKLVSDNYSFAFYIFDSINTESSRVLGSGEIAEEIIFHIRNFLLDFLTEIETEKIEKN